MLIDSHAHLDMGEFEDDLEGVIKRALDNSVEYIVSVGVDLDSSRKAVELSKRFDRIYSAVGIHPHEAESVNADTFDLLKGLTGSKKVVAWGEIGLDYHYDNSPREIQRSVFREQIRIAMSLGLPLVIHTREAREDTLAILREEDAGKVGGVFHCFSGDIDMARIAVEMGFYISFSGIITFPKAGNIREIAKEIPIEKMLIETDSPYLAPLPYRGKRNEPSYVDKVAEMLARIKGLTLDDIARITSLNAKSLFGIGIMDNAGKIAYQIRDSLYLNITNECTDTCVFCVRYSTDFVKGHNLRIEKEPSSKDLISAIEDPKRYKEVVFCGYGEPLIRLDVVKEVSTWVKENGGRVRVDTNGQGNLIHNRNILPELSGLVDEVSVSLNAEDQEKYYDICQPRFGKKAYDEIKRFIVEAKKYIPIVGVTAVDLPEIDLTACRRIALEELGVNFRVREYNVVG